MADETPKLDQYGNEPGVLPDMAQLDQRLQNYQALQDKYGTPGQEAITALEGGAEGVLGPIAPAAEIASGLTTPEDIRGRKAANPFIHGASGAATFVGSLAVPYLKGASLAGAVGKVGELVEHLAPLASPIAKTAVKASAEMMALATSDETSKMITQDPSQSVGTAATNIGLSGLLGLVGGGTFGVASNLGEKAIGKIGDLLTDYRTTQAGLQDAVIPEMEQEAAMGYDPFTKKPYVKSAVSPEAEEEVTKPRVVLKYGIDPFTKEPGDLHVVNNTTSRPGAGYDPFTKTQTGPAEAPEAPEATESNIGYDPFTKKPYVRTDASDIPPADTGAVNPFRDPLSALVKEKGAAYLTNATSETIADAGSAALGALAGHPLLGYIAGHKAIKNLISPLIAPFAENIVNSAAAEKAVGYVADVINGEKLLSNSASNFFKSGAEVLSKDAIPSSEKLNELNGEIEKIQSLTPQDVENMPEGIAHYLPNHQTIAAQTLGTASNYLAGLKPLESNAGPIGPTFQISRAQQMKYDRALSIAEQPLMILKYAKEGKLLQSDVDTLKSIYPGLHQNMTQKLTNALIEHQASGGDHIPYSQKIATSMILGYPLENAMRPQSVQAIMRANSTQQAPQSRGQGKPGKASGATLSQINKVNSLYETSLEANAIRQRK